MENQAILCVEFSFILLFCRISLTQDFTECRISGNPRRMLSYQFAFVHNNKLYEIIFLPLYDKRLPLSIALGHIFDLLEWESYDYRPTRRFRSFVSVDSSDRPVYQDYRLVKEAEKNALFYVDADGKPFNITIEEFNLLDLEIQEKRYGYVSPENYAQLSPYLKKHKYKVAKLYHKWNDFSVTKMYNSAVTIICHAGKVDLSALEFKDFESDIFRTTTEIQGGIVSMMPKLFHPSSGRTYWRYYPCMIDFRDTMCYAPAKQKKLADLGECIGVPKIDIDPDVKNDMDTFLSQKPAAFFEYVSTDSVITLLYSSRIFGYNKKLPITLSSAAAAMAKHILSDYFACKSDDDFNLYYRGLVKKSKGIVRKNGNAGFVEATNLEPVNDKAMLVQQMATNTYPGGVNGSSIIGK